MRVLLPQLVQEYFPAIANSLMSTTWDTNNGVDSNAESRWIANDGPENPRRSSIASPEEERANRTFQPANFSSLLSLSFAFFTGFNAAAAAALALAHWFVRSSVCLPVCLYVCVSVCVCVCL